MRVCLITGTFPPQRCGIGDYTECLARHLASLDVDVHVLTSAHGAPGHHATLKLHRAVRSWNSIGTGKFLAALRKIKPDVAHVQFPSAGYRRVAFFSLIPGILRTLRYSVVLTLHEYTIAQRLDRAKQLVMAAAANQVITTNAEDQASIRRALPWKRDRIHCISIGSNIEVFPVAPGNRSARRQQFGAGEASPVICFFGNLHSGKGLEDLVKAFGVVNSEMPDTRLLMIGTFDPTDTLYSYTLRRMIMETGLAEKVYITGFVTRRQASEFLLASDICVLPFRDGLSVRRGSFLAAIHHGLPVITTAPQSPLPEAIIDGGNVMLVPPGSAGRLAEAIQTLVRSPGLIHKLKQNMAELDGQFSWSDIARRTVEVYRNA